MPEDKAVLLCADDEETPLTLRRLVLKTAGHNVVTAGAAAEAWDIVTSRHVDLVLSNHLKRGSTGANLPVTLNLDRLNCPSSSTPG